MQLRFLSLKTLFFWLPFSRTNADLRGGDAQSTKARPAEDRQAMFFLLLRFFGHSGVTKLSTFVMPNGEQKKWALKNPVIWENMAAVNGPSFIFDGLLCPM
ncbi:hypothetical protein M434DRAFT_396802 [Hypoxylon sp. CO27-5]|nr:hypothetical protein M434DRAFT_396802 [Hypoxylon sp. CO27-5]